MIMEKVNTEKIVSALFCIGFEEVNAVQYTNVFGYLNKNHLLKDFEFEDDKLSSTFYEFFEFDGRAFKFKKGISLSTDYFKDYSIQHEPKPLGVILERKNQKLIDIFKSVYGDISDIMISLK